MKPKTLAAIEKALQRGTGFMLAPRHLYDLQDEIARAVLDLLSWGEDPRAYLEALKRSEGDHKM